MDSIRKKVQKGEKMRYDEIYKWCSFWFEEKRINNDMWRVNVDTLCENFLTELQNYLKKLEERDNKMLDNVFKIHHKEVKK